jgi:hypothetical protein
MLYQAKLRLASPRAAERGRVPVALGAHKSNSFLGISP